MTRPAEGPPRLASYSLLNGRLTLLEPLPALMPDSGITLAPDGKSLLVAESTAAQVDLEVAALE